ncbi:unnamed protein product, partial [Amoebophrya sp. A120]
SSKADAAAAQQQTSNSSWYYLEYIGGGVYSTGDNEYFNENDIRFHFVADTLQDDDEFNHLDYDPTGRKKRHKKLRLDKHAYKVRKFGADSVMAYEMKGAAGAKGRPR